MKDTQQYCVASRDKPIMIMIMSEKSMPSPGHCPKKGDKHPAINATTPCSVTVSLSPYTNQVHIHFRYSRAEGTRKERYFLLIKCQDQDFVWPMLTSSRASPLTVLLLQD